MRTILAMLMMISPVCAQNAFMTPGNAVAPGHVTMCLNGTQQAIPCTGALGAAGYPAGSTPITASGSGTTAGYTVTISAIAAKTAYLCGFVDDAVATAATAVLATITGLLGGTFTYIQQVGTLTGTGNYHYQITYNPCLPANGPNTQIQLTTGAPGAGGVQGAMLWGFYL